MQRASLLLGAVAAHAAAAAAAPLPITVTVGATRVATASDSFRMTGINFDFWTSSKDKWTNASALSLDLSSPDLNTLAGALSGSMLRLGGSPADFLVYEVSPGDCSAENLNKTQQAYGSYFCPIWYQTQGQCLTMSRWRDLLAFASRAGLKLVLDLNACWGRVSASADIDWSQIDGLLNFTASGATSWASSLWGIEFGNEVYSNISPARYGEAVVRLASRLKTLWSGAGATHTPVVIGPDDWEADVSDAYYTAMLDIAAKPGSLHALTIHDYGGDCIGDTVASAGTLLNLTCLDALPSGAIRVAAIAAPYGVPVWNGESALAGNSGSDGLTNTFISSLFYANELGAYAAANVGMVSRQTLVGGDYELVNKSTFQPNPDYWTLLLWRDLMGAAALRTTTSTASPVRAYTHCGGGGGSAAGYDENATATVMINFSANVTYAASVMWPASAPPGATVDVYALTPLVGRGASGGAGDEVDGTAVAVAATDTAAAVRSSRAGDGRLGARPTNWFGAALNGARLSYAPGSGALPPRAPVSASADAPVLLPPGSITWVVMKGAGAAADCVLKQR